MILPATLPFTLSDAVEDVELWVLSETRVAAAEADGRVVASTENRVVTLQFENRIGDA